jgi:glyoxylase-like metal-dependent hydrolase (beta-lactamase superfamily II)
VHYAWEWLADGVYRCRLPFCDVTVGLVRGSAGALLVDTGTTLEEAAAIDRDAQDLTGRRVAHVVLTHKHFDHVLGSSVFAGSEIHCTPEVLEYLSSATDQIREDALRHGANARQVDRAIAALRPPADGAYRAVLEGHQETIVDLGDRTVTITHPGRGHTASDLVVAVRAGADGEVMVVFTGDLVEESGDPAIDADSDVAAWPATLDRVLALGGPRAIYVPGHGRAVGAESVRRQRDWLLLRGAGGDKGIRVGDADP